MRATTRANKNASDFPLSNHPEAFDTWLERQKLASLAVQAVADVTCLIAVPGVDGDYSRLPTGKMMALITYCYAIGVYDSSEIAAYVARDAILRDMCAGTRPTADSIRRFRWANSRALIRALSHVLKMATAP